MGVFHELRKGDDIYGGWTEEGDQKMLFSHEKMLFLAEVPKKTEDLSIQMKGNMKAERYSIITNHGEPPTLSWIAYNLNFGLNGSSIKGAKDPRNCTGCRR